MLPRPIGAALKAGELSRDQIAMWAALACAADPQELEFVGTLDEIMRLCALGARKKDQAWRDLRALKDGGWIEYESTPGQRKPYRIRIIDLRTTSARPPQISSADMRRLTSAGAEVGSGANPHGSGDQPPHDLRNAGGGATAEEEVELEDDVVTSTETAALDAAIAPLGLTKAQALEALRAWRESPEGVEREARDSLVGDRPAGLFMHRIREGAHRQKPTAACASAEVVFSGLTHYISNEGRYYDWSMVEEEIARHETSQRVRLTPDQQQDLFEQWLDEHIELEVG